VVLPELFATGYLAFDAYARTVESLDGATLSTVARERFDEGADADADDASDT
jgi:hypothetical protein